MGMHPFASKAITQSGHAVDLIAFHFRGDQADMYICFLHGLDSSPQGTKSMLLRRHYPGIWIPSLPPDMGERMDILDREMRRPMVVVGSSLGGLTALLFAMRKPQWVEGMVLLAPAVGTSRPELFDANQMKVLDTVYIPEGIPTTVIAGIRDEVIPLRAIRSMIARSPTPHDVTIHEVDDDHNLHQSLDLMLQAIREILDEVS
jgi:pimeloyl-ACP methyl ester carboxylesterase